MTQKEFDEMMDQWERVYRRAFDWFQYDKELVFGLIEKMLEWCRNDPSPLIPPQLEFELEILRENLKRGVMGGEGCSWRFTQMWSSSRKWVLMMKGFEIGIQS